MLTILNVINYLIGRPLSSTMLITLAITIYLLIIITLWEYIIKDTMYLAIIVILLILDIASIIVASTDCVSSFSISSSAEQKENSSMNSNITCVKDTCKINKTTKNKNKNKNKNKKNKNRNRNRNRNKNTHVANPCY